MCIYKFDTTRTPIGHDVYILVVDDTVELEGAVYLFLVVVFRVVIENGKIETEKRSHVHITPIDIRATAECTFDKSRIKSFRILINDERS